MTDQPDRVLRVGTAAVVAVGLVLALVAARALNAVLFAVSLLVIALTAVHLTRRQGR
ncbi:hypothetical protein ACWDXH_29580 [Micromonospora chokoriensis]